MTLQRLQPLGNLLVVCGNEQKVSIKDERTEIAFSVLTESMGRNTAPAVGLVLASGNYDCDDVLWVFPADHYIDDDQEFRSIIHRADELAKEGYLVTVGIKPGYTETCYGYNERDIAMDCIRVQAFHEKPDLKTAVPYVKNGNFLWTAGIFIATVGTWARLIDEYLPGLYSRIQEGQDAYLANYANYPNT